MVVTLLLLMAFATCVGGTGLARLTTKWHEQYPRASSCDMPAPGESFRSLGCVKTGQIIDLAAKGGAEQVLETRGFHKEIIVLLAFRVGMDPHEPKMMEHIYAKVANLHKLGIDNYVVATRNK